MTDEGDARRFAAWLLDCLHQATSDPATASAGPTTMAPQAATKCIITISGYKNREAVAAWMKNKNGDIQAETLLADCGLYVIISLDKTKLQRPFQMLKTKSQTESLQLTEQNNVAMFVEVPEIQVGVSCSVMIRTLSTGVTAPEPEIFALVQDVAKAPPAAVILCRDGTPPLPPRDNHPGIGSP
jgi:hypothetical protein